MHEYHAIEVFIILLHIRIPTQRYFITFFVLCQPFGGFFPKSILPNCWWFDKMNAIIMIELRDTK